ncbi:cytochrome o ubiquinol oxidase subunit IV [Phenylobacterium sp.]|jgi:cytochrome o ubiquinol oxidase operon protein cyoD|uniref:cytochrome o ubiquinol oxidase subunit IV n=1 Tax=Phenylobacterium sp. TaxID=1871053 RepID=UPI002E2EDD8D|nr:cytochrome o ubiquinol oxidase subunit IV [Phenylobacterium sp.]HEX4712179.1 cytochrome o ubiquinol oxidase subunit IV [Phenylobacterium sp.]
MASDLEASGDRFEVAPGDERLGGAHVSRDIRGYVIGLVLATGLTAASFYAAASHTIWAPAIPVALVVLAIAQMGIHLVFFLHISTGPDSTNNILALAFGVLIVALVIIGSIWIMANLNGNMLPMDQLMQMQS